MPENQNNEGYKIYILSRDNYDNWEPTQEYGNNIFFVRENSDVQSEMTSLYVGKSKQSDIVILNDSTIWDAVTNSYNIPSDLMVTGKLFLVKRTTSTDNQETPDNTTYGTLLWNGNSFIDCGNPNNVILIDYLDSGITDLAEYLKQNVTGIKDFFYIIPNYHSMYVFDGTDFISIISVSDFATHAEVQDILSHIPSADGLTIQDNSSVFSGTGADLSGKTIITGTDTPSLAGTGASIFNDYTYTTVTVSGVDYQKFTNTAIGSYSNSFGHSNIVLADFSTAFGSSNTIQSLANNSFCSGTGLTVTNENESVFGSFNTGVGNYIFVLGNGTSSSNKSDLVAVSSDTVYIDPNRELDATSTTFTGHIESGIGTSLSIKRYTKAASRSSQDNTLVFLQYLPKNNSICDCVSTTDWAHPVQAVGFFISAPNVSRGYEYEYGNGTLLISNTEDYSCLLIIPKLQSFTSASDIMINFTAVDHAKIYLLNPDIDISTFTILHIFLFYDGRKMCAIVAGYEEV